MEIKALRKETRRLFNIQARARQTYRESWNRWRAERGDTTTERFFFSGEPGIQELIETEQMYGRWAQLYATMTIMEMLWEERCGSEQHEE